MSFKSNIGNCPIIDDKTFSQYVDPDPAIHGRGMIPRDYAKQPYGSLQYASTVSLPLIPESEWTDRIEERQKTGARIQDLCDAINLKVKDQNGTNYCWINAPVHCLEIMRAVQGQGYVELSPASVGAKIKNFRNVGGWGTEGLKYLADVGCVPTSLWPNNAIHRRYDTEASDDEREKYQVDEWNELRPRSMEEMATCLLLGFPVAIGLNWWRHEVTAIDLVKLDGRGRYGITINNSWGTRWGDNGRGVLSGTKMLPDDAVTPRVVTAS